MTRASSHACIIGCSLSVANLKLPGRRRGRCCGGESVARVVTDGYVRACVDAVSAVQLKEAVTPLKAQAEGLISQLNQLVGQVPGLSVPLSSLPVDEAQTWSLTTCVSCTLGTTPRPGSTQHSTQAQLSRWQLLQPVGANARVQKQAQTH